jgi:tetratricopeptide (TPR) repeat protein
MGDRRGQQYRLHNLGYVYQSLGEMQKALEKYNESYAICVAIGDRRGQADTLRNMGLAYRSLGDLQKAIEKLNESLPISRAVGDRSGEAFALHHIGLVFHSLGEKQKALEKYNEALQISRQVGNRVLEGTALHNIAAVYRALGEFDKAFDYYNKALPINQTEGNPNIHAVNLLGLAQLELQRGNLAKARQLNEQAISIVESLRNNIGSQDLRASYLSTRQDFYRLYIEILMQLHKQNPEASFVAAALAVNERARARSLLELLTEARADIRRDVDSSLLERERSLQLRLSQKSAAQFKLLNREHTTDQADAVAKEIASITEEYDLLETQIRASSPRSAALTQPQPLSLTEIQQQVLDPETLLLEYSLGEDSSYLFIVSSDSINSYQLPKRAEIESATRQLLELVTAPQPRPGETASQRQTRIREASTSYWPQAASLSRMLLGPAAAKLGDKRLLIVADGALQYLPFGVLPVPDLGEQKSGRAGERRNRRPLAHSRAFPLSHSPLPLIVEHEIVNLPSASTLAVLRRETAGRQPAPKAVAVLADPVFSADDARVKHAASDREIMAGDQADLNLTRALSDVRGELSRLLMTRDEAKAMRAAQIEMWKRPQWKLPFYWGAFVLQGEWK